MKKHEFVDIDDDIEKNKIKLFRCIFASIESNGMRGRKVRTQAMLSNKKSLNNLRGY